MLTPAQNRHHKPFEWTQTYAVQHWHKADTTNHLSEHTDWCCPTLAQNRQTPQTIWVNTQTDAVQYWHKADRHRKPFELTHRQMLPTLTVQNRQTPQTTCADTQTDAVQHWSKPLRHHERHEWTHRHTVLSNTGAKYSNTMNHLCKHRLEQNGQTPQIIRVNTQTETIQQ